MEPTKTTRAILFFLSLGGIVALAATASAQTCPAGCGVQKKACLQTARMTKLACKLDCRTNSPPTGLGACMRACTDTFRAAKGTCNADHSSCLGMCSPPTPPPSGCLETCGQDLATCARGVVAAARACVSGCRTAPDRLACLQGCAAAAQAGAAMCAADFATCVTGCGVPPPPPTCGFDPTQGVCAGDCPPGLSCRPPPPGSFTLLACVCRPAGSPSGAFLD